jgi:hypothetical protein
MLATLKLRRLQAGGVAHRKLTSFTKFKFKFNITARGKPADILQFRGRRLIGDCPGRFRTVSNYVFHCASVHTVIAHVHTSIQTILLLADDFNLSLLQE